MLHTEFLLLEPYYNYLDFLNACKKEKEEGSGQLHRHHIHPKHLKIESALRNKTVLLDVEDHIRAHYMLADCFSYGSYERLANLKSARLLERNKKQDSSVNAEISESMRGEKNPFFGKTHSEETRKKISQRNVGIRSGISYDELYKDRSKEEKRKRSEAAKKAWEKKSTEEKKNICEKVKKTKIINGTLPLEGKNPNAKKIIVDGVLYQSLSTAKKILKKSRYKILKEHKIEYPI